MIKNICKKIIADVARRDAMHRVCSKDATHRVSTIIVAAMCILPSCNNYLDVVPDKYLTLETIYSRREEAVNALASVYYYMPDDSRSHQSRWLLGDEWVYSQRNSTPNDYWLPIRLMERMMMPDNPILGTWSGTVGANINSSNAVKNLYQGISMCNEFISRIDGVNDMTDAEIKDWKAQAKFLKAYYHFLLLQQYGPIVIMDNYIGPDAPLEEMIGVRSKIDDCFNYIVETIKEAIPDLELRRQGIDLGKIDRLGATAILARVLLYRASPFYSGNEMYDDFRNHNGELFFPQDNDETKKAKWQDALTAINEAITLCTANSVAMYHFKKKPLQVDQEDWDANDRMKTYYDLRNVITDQWNEEQIWMGSNVVPAVDDIFTEGNILCPTGYEQYNGGSALNSSYCSQELGATYKTLERFYTRNGLPLDEDLAFVNIDNTKYDIIMTPAPSDANYEEYRGILQTNVETIKLYMDRELRFYANVGITGGYWRAYSYRFPTTFLANQPGGRYDGRVNYFWTAIGAQKQVHIDSKAGNYQFIVAPPTPIIRLADLYLMKAEALNETLNAPNQDVWDAINIVRSRAGIPIVQESYDNFSNNPGKYKDKAGMRKIIAHERKVEFAFEGHIFWDMIRTKQAVNEFNTPVMGWNSEARSYPDFFRLSVKQARSFTQRDYLWPIPTAELNKNKELIQNPGW